MSFRIEKDTMGKVEVPSDKYWGAQTERSRNNFKIGPAASMPLDVVNGFAYLKKAAAYTNCELGVLPRSYWIKTLVRCSPWIRELRYFKLPQSKIRDDY